MDTLWQDLCHGARMLLKKPSITLIAIITLALGIGANTAIFSVVNAALLNPFPCRDPDRLMIVQDTFKQEPTSVAFLNYLDWQQQNHVFEAMSAVQDRTFNLTGIDEPEQINGALVSAGVFTICHVFAWNLWGEATRSPREAWISEELAVFSDGTWYGYGLHDLGKHLLMERRLYSLERLMKRLGRDPMIAYPALGSFVKFIRETYGSDKVKQLWQQGSPGIMRIFGKTLKDLGREWHSVLEQADASRVEYVQRHLR